MKPFSTFLMPILDRFVNPIHRETAESRMRARMIVFYFLFQLVLDMIGLALASMLPFFEVVVISLYVLIVVTCLALIRLGVSPEKVASSYIILSLSAVLVIILTTGTSSLIDFNLVNSFNFTLAIGGLVIPSKKIRRFIVLFLTFGNGLLFSFLRYRSENDLLTVTSQMAMITVFTHLGFLLCLTAMILKIRSIAQKDIDQETEWQQRRSRLEETSSMTRTLRMLWDKPIHSFQNNLAILKRAHDTKSMIRMQGDLNELRLISQSFSWIYRAFREEGTSSILSTALFEQLQVLLSTKLREEGWTIRVKQPQQAVEVHGPIPTIMLFFFTILSEILDEGLPLEQRRLSLELEQGGNLLTWTLTWPGPIQELEEQPALDFSDVLSPASKRRELIRELTLACNADIRGFQSQGLRRMQIHGPWQGIKSNASG